MSDATPPEPTPSPNSTGPNGKPAGSLLRQPWFQWMVAGLVAAALLGILVPPFLSLIYKLRGVLAPMLVALGLAYVVNPWITYLEVKRKVPRVASSAGIILSILLVALIALALLIPPLVRQAADLANDLSTTYPQQIVERVDAAVEAAESKAEAVPDLAEDDELAGDTEPVAEPEAETPPEMALSWDSVVENVQYYTANDERREEFASTVAKWLEDVDWAAAGQAAISSLDVGVGFVGSAISFVTYLLGATFVTAFCFFFFSWKFHGILSWCVPYIPESHRDETLRILKLMDLSVTGFIRGRLIQTVVMGVVLTIGWWITGVPYFLLLGVAGGVLNLIPFAPFLVWPVAIVLAWLDAMSGNGFSAMSVLVWPSVAYFIAQGLDGWVVEPIVQGKATALDPVAVFLAVLVGGALAGLLGMLLAIPAAACIKILMEEIALPKLRQLAANRAESS